MAPFLSRLFARQKQDYYKRCRDQKISEQKAYSEPIHRYIPRHGYLVDYDDWLDRLTKASQRLGS